MTLHWWMHWFWVTTLLLLLSSRSGRAFPQSEERQARGERRGKAMYLQGKPSTAAPRLTDSKLYAETLADRKLDEKPSTEKPAPPHVSDTPQTVIPVDNATAVADTPDVILNSTAPNLNATAAAPTAVSNETEASNASLTLESWPLESTAPEEAASRIVTEKPWSLETTLLERSPSENRAQASRERAPRLEGMDTGMIAGISFAALALAALTSSTAFVLYRRRYLNKPQTLNDKCSNPDSSGYLDDSTIRDNSEEMYSLDNDSFLNSLEAMTIQNYWTDVKHSKL